MAIFSSNVHIDPTSLRVELTGVVLDWLCLVFWVAGYWIMQRRSGRLNRELELGLGGGEEHPPPPQNWEQLFAAMQETIRQQGEQIRDLREQQARPAPILAPQVVPPNVGDRMEPIYERFRKQNPPVFEGGPDPLKAEQWMTMIASIFDFMRVENNDRVRCAIYMLRDDARIWWEIVSQGHNLNTMTWDAFRALFYEKYYNESIRAAQAEEFARLVQGSMTVTEYATKFDRLAKFASDEVASDAARKAKFIRGLEEYIARDVIMAAKQSGIVKTYPQIVDLALTAEGAESMIRKKSTQRKDVWKTSSSTGVSKSFSPNDRKRKPDGSLVVGPNRKFQGNQGFRRGRNEVWQPYPECPKCKRHHLGECRSRVCYQCGVAGHFKNNCPQLQKPEAKKESPVVPARVFALTQADAEAGPSTVTGKGKAKLEQP
ncbi:hypothetical protein CsatB_013808 [Cannabis sativa]